MAGHCGDFAVIGGLGQGWVTHFLSVALLPFFTFALKYLKKEGHERR